MPSDHQRFQQVIEALAAARRSGDRFVPGDDMDLPSSHDDAVAVQQAIAKKFGPVGAFKTAKKPDAPRIIAPIFAADILPSPATLSAPATGGLGIELEVGLRVKAPLDGFDDSAAARARTLEPVVVIEVVDTRVAGPTANDPMVKLADNQINRALVVGESAGDWDGGPLTHVTATLRVGDRVLVDGPVDIPGGDAVATLLAVAADLGADFGGLQVGQIVITGTLNPLEYFPAGLDCEGAVDGIGAVRFRIG